MTKKKNNIVGRRVKEIRLLQKPSMTQDQLAVQLQLQDWKIDRFGISKIERGLREISDIEVVMLSKALGVEIELLFPKDYQN